MVPRLGLLPRTHHLRGDYVTIIKNLVGPSGNDPLPQDFQSRVQQPTIRQAHSAACIIFSKLQSLNHHPIFKDQISRELKWPSCFHPRQPLLCLSVVRLNSLSTQATANGFLSNPLFQAKSKLHMCCHHAIYTTLLRHFCKLVSNFFFQRAVFHCID